MATAERPGYMWVPPPPLPEFYMPKEDERKPSSSSSGTDGTEDSTEKAKPVKVSFMSQSEQNAEMVASTDGAYDGLPTQAGRFFTVPPPPPPAAAWNNVPSLAVYHICRLCLRPRSARFHREHPIPINGVPLPPGICQRCRVKSVRETSEVEIDEIVRKGRSNEIKLGAIAPFVPEEAIVSNREAKKLEADRYLRGRSRDRDITIYREVSRRGSSRRCRSRSRSRRRDIVYRHVRVVDESEPRSRTKVVYKPRRDFVYQAHADAHRLSMTAEHTSTQVLPEEERTIPQPVMSGGLARTDSEIRRIANEEVQRHGQTSGKPKQAESEIRRIAREEVTYYREAERKLDAHSQAFAHGRMIPVQHHDAPTTKDAQVASEKKTRIASSRPPSTVEKQTRPSSAAYATEYTKDDSKILLETGSWGPKWRRELSLERRMSSERLSKSRQSTVAETAPQSVTSKGPSNLPKAHMPLATYNVARAPESRTCPSRTAAAGAVDRKVLDPIPPVRASWSANMGGSSSRHQRPDDSVSRVRKRESVERYEIVKERSFPTEPYMKPGHRDRESEGRRGQDADHKASSTTSRQIRDADTPKASVTSRTGIRGGGASGSPTGEPGERGSEAHAAYLAKREGLAKEEEPPVSNRETPSGRRWSKQVGASNVEYEYKLRTVRPADESNAPRPRDNVESDRAPDPAVMTFTVWQQVPDDPEERAREAPRQQKELEQAVEDAWLTHKRQPSSRLAGNPVTNPEIVLSAAPSQPSSHRGALRQRPDQRTHQGGEYKWRPRPPSPQGHARDSSRNRSSDRFGRESSPKERSYELWVQEPVPSKAPRERRSTVRASSPTAQPSSRGAMRPGSGPSRPSQRAPDTAQGPKQPGRIPSIERPSQAARRRTERREHHKRQSEESDHVKFSANIDISPTPPGSDDSSGAFRRFHDFIGRRGSRQIDGHDSEEKGEDLITEYERRGRLRSRETRSRRSEHADTSQSVRNRDKTVMPRRDSKTYDGRRNPGWRPLHRALSESPSRERLAGSRRSSDRGPPYRPEEKLGPSMIARDGSRLRRRDS